MSAPTREEMVAAATRIHGSQRYADWPTPGEGEVDLQPLFVGNVKLPEGATWGDVTQQQVGEGWVVVRWEIVDFLLLARIRLSHVVPPPPPAPYVPGPCLGCG